jgi:hypothetical protein
MSANVLRITRRVPKITENTRDPEVKRTSSVGSLGNKEVPRVLVHPGGFS